MSKDDCTHGRNYWLHKKGNTELYECSNCGFMQSEKPEKGTVIDYFDSTNFTKKGKKKHK